MKPETIFTENLKCWEYFYKNKKLADATVILIIKDANKF